MARLQGALEKSEADAEAARALVGEERARMEVLDKARAAAVQVRCAALRRLLLSCCYSFLLGADLGAAPKSVHFGCMDGHRNSAGAIYISGLREGMRGGGETSSNGLEQRLRPARDLWWGRESGWRCHLQVLLSHIWRGRIQWRCTCRRVGLQRLFQLLFSKGFEGVPVQKVNARLSSPGDQEGPCHAAYVIYPLESKHCRF